MAKTFHWPGEKPSRQHTRAARSPRQQVKAALSPQQKLKRWRGAPVVPGSSLTQGQASRQARAATRVQYGPLAQAQRQQLGEAKGYQRDIGGYYDQYLRQVAQQTQNVQKIGTEANAAMAGLQAGVTGLAGADQSAIQGQANQDAAARGATAGNQALMASNATAVRQALMGSFAAQQAAQNAAADRYAGTLSNVVVPGQKLQALAQAGGKIREIRQTQADTARERGAFRQTALGNIRGEESKNVLAGQIANIGAASKQATLSETTRSHKASESIDRARIRTDRQKARQQAALAAGKRSTSGPFAGLTQAEINGMSDADAAQKISAYDKRKGAGKSKGSSIDFQTGAQRGAGMAQLTKLKDFAARAKSGKAFVPGHADEKPRDRHQAAEKILANSPSLKDPVLVSAALDAVYDGHLSPATVTALHSSGYRVDQVLRTLGTVTRSGLSRRRASKNTAAYGKARPQPQGHY